MSLDVGRCCPSPHWVVARGSAPFHTAPLDSRFRGNDEVGAGMTGVGDEGEAGNDDGASGYAEGRGGNGELRGVGMTKGQMPVSPRVWQ